LPTNSAHLSPFDLGIVAVYLVGITLFGLRFSKSSKRRASAGTGNSLKSYFLADNTIPWWAISLSIVSAETSTLTIISIPGIAYAGDMGFLQIVLGYMLGRIVVAALFLPRYFRGEMLTAYQLIEQRFGPTLHKLTAGLFLLTRAAAEGVRVFAISIVVGIAIGTGDTLSIFIISALTLLYTFEGGLAAVIWTDVVQMALYVAGTLVAMYTLGAQIPGGWAHIHAVAAPLGKFHWLDFSLNLTHAYTFWAGVLGGTFLTMASHGTDQLMVQRMLAARNLRESRLALLSSGVVIFLQFSLFLLIGVGLYVFYSEHPQAFASADRIFPTFIVHQMPHGVAGLLVAAILAAAMSNLSAALNSLASTTVIDFWIPWRIRRARPNPTTNVILSAAKDPCIAPASDLPHSTPDTSVTLSAAQSLIPDQPDSKENVILSAAKDPCIGAATNLPQSKQINTIFLSRAATIFWAVVLFAVAVYSVHAGGKGHVVETGLSIAAVAYGCLLGVFLLGTLTRYATQSGAILGMICGLSLNLALWLLPSSHGTTYLTPTFHFPQIAFTWYVLIGTAATFAVGSLASLTPKRRTVGAAIFLFPIALGLSFRSEAQESASPSVAPSTQQAAEFAPVSALITKAIAAHQLPGAVLIVGHNGHIAFEHAYGNRALEPAVEPMTEDTLFDIASLTKVIVTSTAVLQLYEQGKLGLDTPVAHYLPKFAENGKEKITVRELMTHYSGLPPDVPLDDAWGLAAPDNAEGIRRAMSAAPYAPPGLTFKYSDINFITLAALVEKLTGQPLDVYAEQHIFEPLGMNSTTFHPFAKTCGPAIRTGDAVSAGPKPIGRIGVVCLPGTWSPYALDPRTAPTSHDDQGTAATNPDFDRILLGTVNDPTARRMAGVAGHAGVFSTAHDMSLFAQALLDKLLHNAGPFPLKQSTLQLAISLNEPSSALNTATIFTPDGEVIKGIASHGLGWDLNTAYSRARGAIFPITTREHPGSFGHTGFTGTSLWIDPTSDSYVLLLANSVHPRIGPSIAHLRGEVATAAAEALGLSPESPAATPQDPPRSALSSPGQPPTLTGIDVLEATHFAALKQLAAKNGGHLRLGLLTNQTGLDSAGRRTVDILAHADPQIELTTLFSPEHGLFGKQDTVHESAEQDSATHLRVIALYGPKPADRHPKPADLHKLDAVVIDLQDAGVRFYTYETVTGYFLEACAKEQIPLIILDRPNPIGGVALQGPTSDAGLESYTDFMPIPLRHGLTLGELARYFNSNASELPQAPPMLDAGAVDIGTPTHAERPPATRPGLHATLIVIPMQNWKRSETFASTGLTFTPPSPNLRSPAAELLYPGIGMVEQTNVSVGRGTATPFEHLGAPWINAQQLADYLNARTIPGIKITPTTLTIAETADHYPNHGQTIPGIRFQVTDSANFNSPEFGVELLSALHHLYPTQFLLKRAHTLVANAATLSAVERGEDPRAIAAAWNSSLSAFEQARKPYLLYQ